MPGKDGTGPMGRGRGGGLGRQSQGGMGRGKMGGPQSAGPEDFCECLSCKTRVKHQRGVPCSTMACPQCGSTMVRV